MHRAHLSRHYQARADTSVLFSHVTGGGCDKASRRRSHGRVTSSFLVTFLPSSLFSSSCPRQAQLTASRTTFIPEGVPLRLISIFDETSPFHEPDPPFRPFCSSAIARPRSPPRRDPANLLCLFTNYQPHFHPSVHLAFLETSFQRIRRPQTFAVYGQQG